MSEAQLDILVGVYLLIASGFALVLVHDELEFRQVLGRVVLTWAEVALLAALWPLTSVVAIAWYIWVEPAA